MYKNPAITDGFLYYFTIEMYGQNRLEKSIIKHSKLHSKELLNNIFSDRKEFIKDIIPDENTTIMIIKITQNQ